MNFCQMFIKVDRKQLLNMIEKDQVQLNKAISEERENMRKHIKNLHELKPNILELDPYIRDLLIRETKIQEQEAKTGKKVKLEKIEEIGSDFDESDD